MTTPNTRLRHRLSVATVNLDRVRKNFRKVRALSAPGSLICPMVKADAYGHGDVEIARVLRAEGAPYLGVIMVEEGERLRTGGDKGSVLVFGEFFARESAEAMMELDLTAVASDRAQLGLLEEAALRSGKKSVDVHIEFDTGMGRLGFAPSEARSLREWFDSHPCLKVSGIATHLLRGADLGVQDGDSDRQMSLFAQALQAFRGFKVDVHVLSSAGVIAAQSRALDNFGLPVRDFGPPGSRPGISIYGQEPISDPHLRFGVEPVLRWYSRLARVHQIEKGFSVSYNGTWRAQRKSWIGVVPVGYADGYRRAFSNAAFVLCRGRRVPVVGTVCMDYFMIDLTDLVSETGRVDLNEEVVMIGSQGEEEITATEAASWLNTISYEILTGISARVPRVYVNDIAEGGRQ